MNKQDTKYTEELKKAHKGFNKLWKRRISFEQFKLRCAVHHARLMLKSL